MVNPVVINLITRPLYLLVDKELASRLPELRRESNREWGEAWDQLHQALQPALEDQKTHHENNNDNAKTSVNDRLCTPRCQPTSQWDVTDWRNPWQHVGQNRRQPDKRGTKFDHAEANRRCKPQWRAKKTSSNPSEAEPEKPSEGIVGSNMFECIAPQDAPEPTSQKSQTDSAEDHKENGHKKQDEQYLASKARLEEKYAKKQKQKEAQDRANEEEMLAAAIKESQASPPQNGITQEQADRNQKRAALKRMVALKKELEEKIFLCLSCQVQLNFEVTLVNECRGVECVMANKTHIVMLKCSKCTFKMCEGCFRGDESEDNQEDDHG